jgi:hypothetical protein
MRHAFALAAACLLLLGSSIPPNQAYAKTVTLSGTHSASEIRAKCDAAGGSFTSADSGYGCAGPGGTVNCNTKGKCTGSCGRCGRAAPTGGIGGIVAQPGRGGTLVGAGVSKGAVIHQPVVTTPTAPSHSGRRH